MYGLRRLTGAVVSRHTSLLQHANVNINACNNAVATMTSPQPSPQSSPARRSFATASNGGSSRKDQATSTTNTNPQSSPFNAAEEPPSVDGIPPRLRPCGSWSEEIVAAEHDSVDPLVAMHKKESKGDKKNTGKKNNSNNEKKSQKNGKKNGAQAAEEEAVPDRTASLEEVDDVPPAKTGTSSPPSYGVNA